MVGMVRSQSFAIFFPAIPLGPIREGLSKICSLSTCLWRVCPAVNSPASGPVVTLTHTAVRPHWPAHHFLNIPSSFRSPCFACTVPFALPFCFCFKPRFILENST